MLPKEYLGTTRVYPRNYAKNVLTYDKNGVSKEEHSNEALPTKVIE